jgi:hypothetical protein
MLPRNAYMRYVNLALITCAPGCPLDKREALEIRVLKSEWEDALTVNVWSADHACSADGRFAEWDSAVVRKETLGIEKADLRTHNNPGRL